VFSKRISKPLIKALTVALVWNCYITMIKRKLNRQLGVPLLLLFVFGLLNMIRAIFIGDITLVIVFGLIAVIGAAALYKLAPEK